MSHELNPSLSKHDETTHAVTVRSLPSPESCSLSCSLTLHLTSLTSTLPLNSHHPTPRPPALLLPQEKCDSYAGCQTQNRHHRQDRHKQVLGTLQRWIAVFKKEQRKSRDGSLSLIWQRSNCGERWWKKQRGIKERFRVKALHSIHTFPLP